MRLKDYVRYLWEDWFSWLLIVVTAVLCALSQIALGYPENLRLGYNGCNSCHVSPTGGGVLTAYGRQTSEELATVASDGDGKLLSFVTLPDWVAVGGDYRYVSIRTPQLQRSFVMQTDLELAMHPTPDVWVAGSVGTYGPDRKTEMRRNYVLWSPSDYVSLRGGRFFPAYGLMLPDHTAATRGPVGWQEGTETYNLEISVHSEWGELVVTDTFGGEESVTMNKEQGYRVRGEQPGAAVRAAVYLKSRGQAGASYWFHSTEQQDELVAGPFVMWGITRDLYLLAEADRKMVTAGFLPELPPPIDLTYTELGYELWRGVHLQLTHEYEHSNRYGVGLQLFPVPHAELLARAKYQDGQWTTVLMYHASW